MKSRWRVAALDLGIVGLRIGVAAIAGYARRMAPDPERFARARALFDELAALPGAERDGALAARGDVDPAVRAQVAAWLAADDGNDEDATAPGPIAALRGQWQAERAAQVQAVWVGRRVGQFELVRAIGQGGMGTVWLGERRDGAFVQRVAVKLLGAAHDPEGELLRRFRTEREVLAALDHPGIARLIDGGETEEGVPWLVMEYVDGERIDRWCELQHADFVTRVRLVLAVGEALEAAHAALIVHRDLKPANILVDRNGRPRLLDFGIAKAIDARGLQHTIQQTAADQRLMTLRYASPEQVRGGSIGTASDQYSLAVVLYELIAGQSPYGEVDTSSLDLMQAICEHDPAPPSRVARALDATGRTLERARRGFGSDLDAILRKALRKAPGERYASIGAFLDDLRRLLDGQPVAARQGDRAYRARKFVRRHRVAMTMLATVLLALTTVALNWRWQRDAITRERDRAEQTTRFLTDLFEQANPMRHRGQVPDAVAMAGRGADALLADAAMDRATRAGLLRTSAHVLLALGQYAKALEVANAALVGSEQWRVRDADLRVALQLLQADALAGNRRDDEAVAILEALRRDASLRDGLVQGRALRTEVLNLLARVEFERNRIDAAAAALAAALASWQNVFGHDPERALLAAPQAGVSGELLASLLLTRCRIAVLRAAGGDALERCNEAQQYRERYFPADHPGQLNVLNELAVLAGNAGEATRARELAQRIFDRTREIFGDAHPRTAVAALNLGIEYRAAGRYEEAITLYRLAHQVFLATRGPDHPHTLLALNNWANVLYTRGDYTAALQMHRDVQLQRRASLPADDADLAQSAANVAKCLWRLGRNAEAQAELAASPTQVDAGARRARRLLLAHLALARGEAEQALAEVRAVRAEIAAAAPDVRGLAASAWIEALALAAMNADVETLRSALTATEAALGRDPGREFVREDEVARWRREHPRLAKP
ncbi:MAG: serine/threonine protein kinase [Xanthomonadales bacterium]|nr:serine/threonine protein kinase [Xanthomonadales bacterium]